MARRPVAGQSASDAGGRTYVAPKKKRRKPAPRSVTTDHPSNGEVREVHRIVSRPPASVRNAANAVGQASVRGSRAVGRGVDRTVGRVQAEAAQEKAARQAAAIAKLQAAGISVGHGHNIPGLRDLGRAALSGAESVGRGAVDPNTARRFYKFASTPGPAKYEKTTDLYAGKSLSNLLFHGNTSHLGASALEGAALLPVFRGVKAVDELVSAGRTARQLERTVTIPEHVAGVRVGEHKVKVADLPGRIRDMETELKAAQGKARTAESVATYRKLSAKHGAYVSALEKASAQAAPRARSVAELQRRLKVLDKQYKKAVRAVADQHFEMDVKDKRLIAASRNKKSGVKRARQGKTPNQEIMDAAEGKMQELAAKNPDAPWAKLIVERDAIKAHLNALESQKISPSLVDNPAELTPPAEGPAVGASPEDKLKGALGGMDRTAAENRALSKQEASIRAAKGAQAGEAAGGGFAGQRAALAQLRGAHPRAQFEKLAAGNITEAEAENLLRGVDKSDLKFYEKVNARDALTNMYLHSKAPTAYEVMLLRDVFGAGNVATPDLPFSAHITEILNIPRTLMATFDVSAPFRQGLVAFARHPVLGAKGLPEMFKYLFSEDAYQSLFKMIHADPVWEKAKRARLNLTALGKELSSREEGLIAEGMLAKELPVGGVDVNVPGRIIHASGRAYTGFLDYMRFVMFKEQLRLAAKAGVNIEDDKEVRAIANLVNNATGRGDFGPIESWAPALNAVFFSPRLAATRANMLGLTDIGAAFVGKKGFYGNLTPYARKQAVRSMVQLGAAGTAMLAGGVYLLNGKVTLDPRSSDFAKLKFGDTRADVLGGFQQYVRVVSQLVSGEKINSRGNVVKLGHGIGQTSRYDVATNFAQGKASPMVSLLVDIAKGTAFGNQPLTVQNELATRMIPLVAQDAWDLYKSKDSVKLALIGYGISAFGVGMQTYPNPTTKKQAQKLKDWSKDATAVWHQNNPGLPLPHEFVRAKQNQLALEQATADAGSDEERWTIMLDYLQKHTKKLNAADMKFLRRQPASRENMDLVRGALYGDVLADLNTEINARKKAHGG